MPKAMFAIWWDDALGPLVGRVWPEDVSITSEEAITIFMGHGTKMESQIGYTKIPQGLIVSYMNPPNCIAVLLEDEEDPATIERNLLRIVPTIDFSSSEWDSEIKKAYTGLVEVIKETSGDRLLSTPGIRQMIQDMYEGRLPVIKPRHILVSVDRYPEAANYLGQDHAEVKRILKDLESEGILIPRTFGRRIECRQCGSSETKITLQCPNCSSEDLYNVYAVYCPLCSGQFHTVIVDEISEVTCQKCKQPVSVSKLAVLDVEPLCNGCGTASEEPKIVLTCAVCGKHLKGADLLAGTGLAYIPLKTKNNGN